jgi:imidazolonepropionase-like amidohydrolase
MNACRRDDRGSRLRPALQRLRGILLPGLAAALAAAAPAARAAGEQPARDFAVRAGSILTMDGAEHAPGVLVVRNGKVAAVGGADLAVPAGLPVVEAGGGVLMPGFVEAHGSRGLDGSFETRPDASFVRASDALNPASLPIADARRNGLTTLLVSPPSVGLLAGRAAIIHPQGVAVDGMIVRDDFALKISLAPAPGSSRMGHLARLRSLLDGTRRWLDERDAKRKDAGRRAADDEVPATREALVALLAGELTALVDCPTAADVSTALALAREHELPLIVVLGPGAWRAADLLAVNRVPVVLTPDLEAWETQPDGTLRHVSLPRILADAGVEFALTTDPSAIGAQHPWFQAAAAVRAGVPRDAALAAITRVPARILGFGTTKGVLRVGADADLVLLSDDPLSGRAWVEAAWVKGARIYERASDAMLSRLLSRLPEPPMSSPELDHPLEPEYEELPAGTLEEELGSRWPVPPGPAR